MWIDPSGNVHLNFPDDSELAAMFVDIVASCSDSKLSNMRQATRVMALLAALLSSGPERYNHAEERYNHAEESFEQIDLPADVVEAFTLMWRQEGWSPGLISQVDPRWRPDLLFLLDEVICDELERRGLGYFDVVNS